jgi:hypothetical protein
MILSILVQFLLQWVEASIMSFFICVQSHSSHHNFTEIIFLVIAGSSNRSSFVARARRVSIVAVRISLLVLNYFMLDN